IPTVPLCAWPSEVDVNEVRRLLPTATVESQFFSATGLLTQTVLRIRNFLQLVMWPSYCSTTRNGPFLPSLAGLQVPPSIRHLTTLEFRLQWIRWQGKPLSSLRSELLECLPCNLAECTNRFL